MSSSSTLTRPRVRSAPTRSVSVIGLSSGSRAAGSPGQTTGECTGPAQAAALVVADLVQELLGRRADPLQAPRLDHGQIRITDVPALCGDLVRGKVVLGPGAADPRPAFPSRVHDVQVVGDLRHEV